MESNAGLTPLLIDISYLVAAVFFIVGLKRLSSPETARSGNMMGALGMFIAVGATLFSNHILSFTWIIVGTVIGGAIGAVMARTVAMTAMPQMVAIFNGFGGGASALVAADEYLRVGGAAGAANTWVGGITIVLGVLIGALTFSGSFIAWGKLQGVVTEKAVSYPGQKVLNALLLLAILAVGAWVAAGELQPWMFVGLAALALLLGVTSVIPIGGADMPVVIALLNSYSGLAASAAGFVLNNNVLIIAGALVGASGLILTNIMCRAMNRSLANVLFGAFGGDAAVAGAGADTGDRTVREISVEDAATLMAYSRSVVVVPGYGLAVAQAQHTAREMGELLAEKGVDVRYAIHPVAGRMPGHMNVLLAEAGVEYDKLWEMEQINPDMDKVDVALIVGANDVVNPAARTDPGSPIYGMPIINVDYAKHTIVMKRSMASGFAGIDNPLFYNENNRMLFGDAKKSISRLVEELKAL
ncbi:MAG TPA: NAD(P)(+) transhydrogenase (Re/Si-specific) subunit beta [Longimicrobiales bacterium]|nr:NAD(P)(+) transhydrogenase (Re/Si-specific) subunit beta [Longimicrobiales bacterium]